MSEFWETLFVPISNHTAAQTFSSCIVTFPRQRCARYCNSVHQWCSPLSSPIAHFFLHFLVAVPRLLTQKHPPQATATLCHPLLYSSFSSSCLASKTSTTSVRWASRVLKVDRSLALPPSPYWFNFEEQFFHWMSICSTCPSRFFSSPSNDIAFPEQSMFLAASVLSPSQSPMELLPALIN